MTITARLYGAVMTSAFNKEIDWGSDTPYCMLTTSAYTPDQDTHDYKNDVANEVTGTGYTAGGAAIANPTVTYTGATNKFVLDGDDVSWTTSTINARTAVIYDRTPATDATRPLVCYQQSDVDISSSGGTFQVTFAAAGIVEVTLA